MKLKFLLLSAAFIGALACTKDPEIHKVGGGDEDKDKETEEKVESSNLLVCSFNIRTYNTTDPYLWADRKGPAMNFIRQSKLDIVGLQEVKPTQSQDIAYSLSDSYGYYDIDRDTGKGVSSGTGEGCGILYLKERFTLLDKGFFWLADPSDKLPAQNEGGTYSSWNSACRRIVVWTKLKDTWHNDQTVFFFATHFDHVSAVARKESGALCIKKIKELTGVSDLSRSGSPIFLVADFNIGLSDVALDPIRTSMSDAKTTAKTTETTGTTYNGWGSQTSSVIDHIFYAGNLSADRYHIVTEDWGIKYLSDHYPITLQCSYK